MNRTSVTASISRRWPVALALLSAGVTAGQVALMQILSYVQWHHFAYLVVSVALLGFGASGTLLSLAQRPLLARATTLVPWLMIGSGAGFALIPALLQVEWLQFDLYLLFVERDQWARLAATCVLLALPFFCAGLASGLILTADVQRAGRLYAANLGGAGVGALGGLALLEAFAPPRLPGLVALLPLAGAMVLCRRGERAAPPPARTTSRSARPKNSLFLVTLACVLLALALASHAERPGLSPFKDLSRALDLPEARVVVSEPSAQGWLEIVDAPALRGGPPASLLFAGAVPRQLGVFVDGNRQGSILREGDDAPLSIFHASPEALPWRLGAPRRVLLLQEGAGGEATFAQRQGATEVVLVEPHRGLARELRERLPSADGDTLRIAAHEPRLVLAQAEGKAHFDLIRWPSVGAIGGSAGLRAVGEEYLLTGDAIAAALRALPADGMVLVTAWMDHPERTVLRLLATLIAGLEETGATEPPAHLAAVRGWSSVTFVVRRRALDDADVRAIRAFCEEQGFDPLLLPGLQASEREQNHAWDNPDFFARVDAIAARGSAAAPIDPRFRLDAPTDDRPYFSQFLRPTAFGTLARTHGIPGAPFFELGSIVVAITSVLLLGLATLCIVLPLTRARSGSPSRGAAAGRAWTFCYFAALGAGFMLVEIGLMLRLTSFAGGAIPAAAVVIATLLTGAGLGSYWSQRWTPRRAILWRITTVIAITVAVLGVATRALPISWDLPWLARLACCAAILAPVSFVLGMAFPTGLRHLANHAPAQVPWAWAINNCLSVATPPVATLVALQWGHGMVFVCAALVYASATVATRCAPAGAGRAHDSAAV